MVIPFVILPGTNETINLANVVKMKELTENDILIYFSNGKSQQFRDEAANAVKAEILFHLDFYHQFQKQMLNPQQIVTPNGKPQIF